MDVSSDDEAVSPLLTEFGDDFGMSLIRSLSEDTTKLFFQYDATLTSQVREIVVALHENFLCSVYFYIFVFLSIAMCRNNNI